MFVPFLVIKIKGFPLKYPLENLFIYITLIQYPCIIILYYQIFGFTVRGLQQQHHLNLNTLKICADNEPLTSSSSSVVLESVDSFTCDPSPFFVIILLPARPKCRIPGTIYKQKQKNETNTQSAINNSVLIFIWFILKYNIKNYWFYIYIFLKRNEIQKCIFFSLIIF